MATYAISGKESQDESLHSARKCCIFAPALHLSTVKSDHDGRH